MIQSEPIRAALEDAPKINASPHTIHYIRMASYEH